MLFFPVLAAIVLHTPPATSPDDDAISLAARQPPREARAALAQAGTQVRPDDARSLARLSRAWADTVAEKPDPSDATARQAAQQALDLAEAAVHADPHSAQAHLALAIACGKETDFVDSRTKVTLARRIRAEAERAIALDPQLALAYHVLGRWHLGMAEVGPFARLGARFTVGQLPSASMQEAVRNLAKAAELQPRSIAFHQYLAIALQSAGQKGEAMRHWRIVRDLPAESHEDEEAQRQARAALGR